MEQESREALTRETILAMQPGRELDALVEQHVFGKSVSWIQDEITDPYPVGGQSGYGYIVEYYSTDIAAAWEVVEKMRTTHKQYITIHDNPHLNYDVRFSGNKSKEYERLSNLPHAICRAALLATLEDNHET